MDDIYGTCEQLRQGGKVVREPGPMKHGSTVIAQEDPDGYKVELIQLSFEPMRLPDSLLSLTTGQNASTISPGICCSAPRRKPAAGATVRWMLSTWCWPCSMSNGCGRC